MAFKRALVVDDSRTARQSLAKLLAQYDLEVAFAETGEEALSFLNHELVDVIFMDHTMPGMDGLEAVSAIKGNPRTATIPVMMYTTKEGEVYVSQARALGAVGVLPKQVQPGVLFDMLCKLGLAADRRGGDSPPPEAPRRRLADLADEADREYEQRALGASVQAQVTRVLEQQHVRLRADIAASQQRFAHQVAAEVLEQHRARGAGPEDLPGRTPGRVLVTVTLMLGTALLVMGAFTWHLMAGRDAARLEVARLTTASRNELDALYQRNDGLAAVMRREQLAAQQRRQAAIEALQWSLNQNSLVAYDALPFGDPEGERLAELLTRLAALEFSGVVRLTANLAPFCLIRNGSASLEPAPPDLPGDACEITGHPLQDVDDPAALQSVAFATALQASDRHPGITIELAVRGPFESAGSMPSSIDRAGDWNRLASKTNRVEVALIPSLAEGDAEVAQRF